MLEIKQLSWSQGQKLIFNKLDLSLKAGEHAVIVGGSGSGKSTLLRVVADNRHSSSAFDDGVTATMVMQEGALLDHLTVAGNLRLVQRYHNGQDDTQIAKQLTGLNIDSSLHEASINQLSGGQMRRVAIARALLTQPDVILFDEPDAGLDIANLQSLASNVNELTFKPQLSERKACITVSHNPFYIARVASHVYCLQDGALHLVASWTDPAQNELEYQQRQLMIQNLLSDEEAANEAASNKAQVSKKTQNTESWWQKIKATKQWVLFDWLKYSASSVYSLIHYPKSWLEAAKITAYTSYLSLFTGLLFFAMVGAMLGCTTIAVVKLLSDKTLTGLIGMFLKPHTLLDMMGGTYVLYLAPAIGSMLFVARSGSMMSNWLGEMVRANQVDALTYLNVPTKQYLTAPSVIGLFISSFITIVWFAVFVWIGSVFAAHYLFKVQLPMQVMSISFYDVKFSLFLLKTILFSSLIAVTVTALGLAPKRTAHQVNIYTTKAIIYSTLSIALAELLIILV